MKYNPTGRPVKFETTEQLETAITEYFKSCNGPLLNKKGEPCYDDNNVMILTQVKPYTMSGLARALDMARLTLISYGKKEKFYKTVLNARRLVEEYTESQLFDRNGVQGAKFSLTNNFEGWNDKQVVEHTGVTTQLIGLSDEELESKYKQLQRAKDCFVDSSPIVDIKE